MALLSAEELLAGGALTYEVTIPSEVLHPTQAIAPPEAPPNGAAQTVRLQPLTVKDLQLISRAAKENDALVAALMVQRALVDPQLTLAQVSAMHAGLMQFLVQQINQISGITTSAEQQSAAVAAPLTRAAFVLAKEFGWTPQQINDLTLGQILLHLQLLNGKAER
ncbi:MAG TPA: hypothetical protein IGS37_10015 [Synechococcales cyanobacterium M55_K2018_004]|nr:hypothetical protein [Synechococcales cyanobacterium M55_K2018_004]